MRPTRKKFLVMAVAMALAPLLAACDWTMFRFDPGHSGVNPERATGPVDWGTFTTRFAGTAGGELASNAAVIIRGVVYIGSSNGSVHAFDAHHVNGCAGSPPVCAPLFTAAVGSAVNSSPAVANGLLFVGAADGKLRAFDAFGNRNCGGAPKTCTPLWTASTGGSLSTPTVVNGVVFAGSADHKVYAFDALGHVGCGVPPGSTVPACAPFWVGTTGGAVASPAVVNGTVYVAASDAKLYVFDAAGNAGCSGDPLTCTPLWTGVPNFGGNGRVGPGTASATAVVDGVVYFTAGTPSFHSGSDIGLPGSILWAFDASGTGATCTGAPTVCTPLWSELGPTSSPAIVNSTVYSGGVDFAIQPPALPTWAALYSIPTATTGCTWDGDVSFQDACFGHVAALAPQGSGGHGSSPAIASGVVYVSGGGKLYAFDLGLTQLWSTSLVGGDPIEESGLVYVGSTDQALHVFGAPAP